MTAGYLDTSTIILPIHARMWDAQDDGRTIFTYLVDDQMRLITMGADGWIDF
ncbi:MAG: hypothetical protein V3V15_12140 [Sphingorhabdus sp.]